ncbi:DUF1735 domain-containing protein [Spirosoma oryzicola]|uniref:DUF1735 domain-containing protein n=1 Tax=Spirosoma oryzicola TaxID=2898794 RepID=UPI001E4507FB|nr:DUF1735 domain-containing protein [Spirosoma oryzicola]UHG94167.1 DUF1735 domain-containing protein [Spirosoma oryzicola]
MMNTLVKSIIALSLALSLTSCLNDDEHFVDFASAGYVAEIPYAANRSVLKTVSVPATSSGTVAPVDVNIASPNPPTQDIPVTVAIDQAALTAYNTANNTAYTLLPATAFQLTNPTVTVAAGQRIATVAINLIGTQIPATGGPYAVPISITTVPQNVIISANYHTQILVISRTQ